MPTRFIHSKSSLMPSLVMLPFIQCHQTRGLAEFGGFLKPSSREAVTFCEKDGGARVPAKTKSAIPRMLAMREWLMECSCVLQLRCISITANSLHLKVVGPRTHADHGRTTFGLRLNWVAAFSDVRACYRGQEYLGGCI